MKKYLLILLIIPTLAFADIIQELAVLARKNVSAGTPTCTESFDVGDRADVTDGTNLEAETDVGSILNIVSNRLEFDLATSGTVAHGDETSCYADSDLEHTETGTLTFDDITNVDNGTSYVAVMSIYDDANSQAQAEIRIKCSGGNIYSIEGVFYHDGGTSYTNTVVMTGVAADTAYNFLFYWKKDASTGGAYFKLGAWSPATTAFNQDNSLKNGGGTVRFGGDNYLGDGTTDTNLYYDTIKHYKSDER